MPFKKGKLNFNFGGLSKTHKEKISIANTGHKGNQYWKGKTRPPFSKQWKENLSKAHGGPRKNRILKKSYGTKDYLFPYIYCYVGNGKYKAEHRITIEKYLGRELLKKEIVHHQDGNSLNNSLSNLKLFLSQGEHGKEEMRLGLFAKQLLYGKILDNKSRKEMRKIYKNLTKLMSK